MNSHDFFLLLKENYVEEQAKPSEVLFNPTLSEKAKELTLLSRPKSTVEKKKTQLYHDWQKISCISMKKCNKFFIDVEARTALKNQANLEKNLRKLGWIERRRIYHCS